MSMQPRASSAVDEGATTEPPTAAGQGTADLVRCEGLRKAYGDHVAVDGVGFTIAPGEAYGLLGPNGAGKTTTISMLCGLQRPDEGRVVVAGVDMLAAPAEAKARIGFVPQDLAIYPDLSARENLTFFGRLYGLAGTRLRERIDTCLEVVGLTERAGDLAGTYSGGMKRRLNIAAGLLHEPQLLVLDEPTVGVDPQSRNAILESVDRLGAEGMALLYTSHYMEEVERLCDRIGIVDHGRMIAEGTRRELVASISGLDRVDLDLHGDPSAVLAALDGLPGCEQVTVEEQRLTALSIDGAALVAPLVGAVAEAGASVAGVVVTEPDLEAVFLSLTGRALRN